MENVFLVTNGDQNTAYQTAKDALEPFVTTRGDWCVYIGETDAVIPVIPANVEVITNSLIKLGHLEFRQGGTNISRIPFRPDTERRTHARYPK